MCREFLPQLERDHADRCVDAQPPRVPIQDDAVRAACRQHFVGCHRSKVSRSAPETGARGDAGLFGCRSEPESAPLRPLRPRSFT